jgi:hypothetical protein
MILNELSVSFLLNFYHFQTRKDQIMNTKSLVLLAGACATILGGHGVLAQQQKMDREHDQLQVQQQVRSQDREQIYGYDLMTEQERQEHREKMRSMQTEQEREAYRAQHHEEMQRRAREQGVDIPDEPPGQGQGRGKGQGQGKGKGYGQGPGNSGQGSGGGKGGSK